MEGPFLFSRPSYMNLILIIGYWNGSPSKSNNILFYHFNTPFLASPSLSFYETVEIFLLNVLSYDIPLSFLHDAYDFELSTMHMSDDENKGWSYFVHPSPGGGLPLIRYWLLSIATAGTGMQDAVLLVFLLEKLMVLGASRFIAFLPIALGGLIAVPLAAIMNVLGARGVRWRQVTSFTMLYIAAGFVTALAFAIQENKPGSNLALCIFLATGFRAASQSSPIVPMLHDSARVFGCGQEEMRRRLIATATLYIWYRIGFISVAIVIAVMPNKLFDHLSLLLLCASATATVLITISAIATHGDPTKNEWKQADHAPFRASVREHFDAAFLRADRRLLASYIETIAYGLAFGLLGAVMSSFFNEQVFNVKCGSVVGMRWASYTTLTFQLINFLFDALLPIVVFHNDKQNVFMPIFWVSGALLGAVAFYALKWVKDRVPALILFGLLAITTSTHHLFSLCTCGGYVEPKLRGTVFGVRAACGSVGVFIGAFVGGSIANSMEGFDFVMLFCSMACAVSGIAAALGGSVSYESVDGVTVNANPLLYYVFYG